MTFPQIKPGQTLTFHATWNQLDDDGKIMPRGGLSSALEINIHEP